MFDMRMYTGVALSPQQVNALATAPTLELSSDDRCFDIFSSAGYYDKRWNDEHGRGCEWYERHRKEAPSVCTLHDPVQHCPVACRSRQPCFFPGALHVDVAGIDAARMVTLVFEACIGGVALDRICIGAYVY